jgi:ATP-dependent RNA helicase DeaD
VDQLTETLNGRGYRAEALHGGMDQAGRDRVMGRLRAGTAELLVATDVAARGLDIDQLTHVVNYDVPSAPEAYVHRIGRVGRAGREGVAITLAEPREQRMLKNIERITKQTIEIAKVPTIADLRNRRIEGTLASVREALLGDDLEHFRVVVDTLSDDHDLMDIALAAVKLAHEASVGSDDDEEIPEVSLQPDRPKHDRVKVGAKPSKVGQGMTRLYINAGRSARIRPNDIVGAIANETRLSGRDIGAIEIADQFSLVEVPDDAVDEVIARVNASTIAGKKRTIRRERYTPGK